MKRFKLLSALIVISFYLFLSKTSAQILPVSAGGDIDGNIGSLAFSIGQIFYTQEADIIGSRTQGVQQPYIAKSDSDLIFSLDTIQGATGDEIVMKVRVTNFRDLVSVQFSLQFDPALLRFKSVEDFALDPSTSDFFGLSKIQEGFITFAWGDDNLEPSTLNNGTTLFSIRFEILGEEKTDTRILFTDVPLAAEFVTKDLKALDNFQFWSGLVMIREMMRIDASIYTENNQGIASVTIKTTGNFETEIETNDTGKYAVSFPKGQQFVIIPEKANDQIPENGITVADVMLIKRHILLIQQLNSPYKIIAADVSQDGRISMLDVSYIIALLKGDIDKFPNNKLWRFVPENHVFVNPQNPFPFPESISADFPEEGQNLDFIGVKLGDVDNTYNATSPRTRQREVVFYTDIQDAEPGKNIIIPVNIGTSSKLAGFQFIMHYDSEVLLYQGVEKAHPDIVVETGGDIHASGTIRVFWTNPSGRYTILNGGDAMIKLVFRVVGSSGMDTEIQFSGDKQTPVEVLDDQLLCMNAVFKTGKIAIGHVLSTENDGDTDAIQLYPNPFSELINIKVQDESDSQLEYVLFNENGKEIKRSNLEKTQQELSCMDIMPGVYFMQIRKNRIIIKIYKLIKL